MHVVTICFASTFQTAKWHHFPDDEAVSGLRAERGVIRAETAR